MDEQGQPQTLDSGDVNDYLREIVGGEFTARDFRTWGGTCLAAGFLMTNCTDSSDRPSKAALAEVVKQVGLKLGNKPAACKKYYIHPAVMNCYTGNLLDIASRFRGSRGTNLCEQVVLSLLTQAKAREKKVA